MHIPAQLRRHSLLRTCAVTLALLGLTALSTTTFVVFDTSVASAQNSDTGSALIKIEPAGGSSLNGNGERFAISVEPGKSSTQKLIVTNTSSEFRVTASLTGVETTPTADGSLSYKEPSTGSSGNGNWVRFVPSAIQLNPGEAREVPFTISVPAVEPAGPTSLGIALTIQSTVSTTRPDQTAGAFTRSQFVGVDLTILGAPAPQLSVLGARPVQTDGLDYLQVFMRNTGNADAKGNGRFDVPEMGVTGTFNLEPIKARSDSTQLVRWQPNRDLNDRFGVALTIIYGTGSTTSWSGRVGLGDRAPVAPPLDATDTPGQLIRDKDANSENIAVTPSVVRPTQPDTKSGLNLWLIIGIPLGLLLLIVGALLVLWLVGGRKRAARRKKQARTGDRSSNSGATSRSRSTAGDEVVVAMVDSLRLLVSEIMEMKGQIANTGVSYQPPHLQPGFYDHPVNGRMEPVPQATPQSTPQPIQQPMHATVPVNTRLATSGPAAYADTAQFVPAPSTPSDIVAPSAPVVPVLTPPPVAVTRAFVYDHDHVVQARGAGHSWDTIAIALGTTADDVLMRYTNEENRHNDHNSAKSTATAATHPAPFAPPTATPAPAADPAAGTSSMPVVDPAHTDSNDGALQDSRAVARQNPPQSGAIETTPLSFLSQTEASTPEQSVFEETVTVTRTVRRSGDASFVESTLDVSSVSPFLVAEEIPDLPAPVRGGKTGGRGHLRALPDTPTGS